MPRSFHFAHTHIIFSTKNRGRLIQEEQLAPLHRYMAGVLRAMECRDILVNGVADHVHIYCLMTKQIAASKVMEALKRDSSKWMKSNGGSPDFYWQSGYGMFSVSPLHVEPLKRYIREQEEHHRQISFQDEYRKILKQYGFDGDESYLWD